MIRLPSFIFLQAPAGSGKTTLQALLIGQDAGMAPLSFAEPLRMACLGTFFPDDLMQGRDLRDPGTKNLPLPIGNWTAVRFMIDYGNWLKSKTNDFIFGDLAKRQVESLKQYYTRFCFDDARIVGDVAPFMNGYGAENCLLIHIERRSAKGRSDDVGGDGAALINLPGIRHISIYNNDADRPETMLIQLEAALGSTPSPARESFTLVPPYSAPQPPTLDDL